MPKRNKGPAKTIQRSINKANVSLAGMATVLEQQTQTLQQLTQGSAEVQSDKNGGGSAQLIALQIARAQLALQKDSNEYLKKIQASQNKQVEQLQKGNKDWKSFGDKFKDFKGKMSDAFDPDTIKKKLLGPFSMFKGVKDKMADIDYAKRMKAMGDVRDKKELKQESAKQRAAGQEVLRSQEKLDKFKQMGASEDQIKNTAEYKNRNDALQKYNSFNVVQKDNKMGGDVAIKSAPLPKTPSDKGQVAQSTTDMLAEQQSSKENQLESIRILGSQTDLLQQIANNTAKGDNSSAGGGEDAGGGKSSGALGIGAFGLALKSLGVGLKSLGTGAGKGIEAIFRGLAKGAMALANPAALIGLGAFTLAMVGLGGALRLAAPAIEAFAPVLMKFADVVGDVFVGAIQALPGIIKAVGEVIVNVIGAIGKVVKDTMDAIVTSVERLAGLDGDNMLSVGAGLGAIAAGLVAFGGANVFAGITNLVSGLLNMGGDSPIDQLLKLSNSAGDLNAAAQGIGQIGEAMRSFSNVDPKQMQAINDFPWVRATAFVAAGGSMSVSGAKVYNTSKGNADADAKASTPSGTNQTSVTQVNQSSVQNTTVKPNIRNQESSQSRYMQARY